MIAWSLLILGLPRQAMHDRQHSRPANYLDVGGNQPCEAPGIERVLAGLRASIDDDDQLTTVAGGLFDGLLTAFASEEVQNG